MVWFGLATVERDAAVRLSPRVLGHAAVVAGVVRGEVGDDQEAGHLVDADSFRGLQGDPIPEPGD